MGATNPNSFPTNSVTTGGWENNPADADKVFRGAGFIRSTRRDLRAVISTEHVLDDEDFDIGEHAEGSAKCYVLDDAQASVPGGVDNSRGRMRFNKEDRSMAISDGESFIPMGSFFPGQITMSAVVPDPIVDGWALCTGQLVSVAQNDGIYARLVRRLANNANATQVRLPDLRNQFIRGWTGGLANVTPRQVVNTNNVQTGSVTDAYSYQDHAFEDHKHEMKHSHGAAMAQGRDNAAGRTGVVQQWLNGNATIDDDGRHQHNFNAVLTKNRSISTGDFGSSFTFADNPTEGTTVDNALSDHHHEIPRYNGTTGFAGIAANANEGVEELEYNTADETRPDNVSMYYVIKL
jgi:microcystin-dependent protein